MNHTLDGIESYATKKQVGLIEVENRFKQIPDAIKQVSRSLKDSRGQVGKWPLSSMAAQH